MFGFSEKKHNSQANPLASKTLKDVYFFYDLQIAMELFLQVFTDNKGHPLRQAGVFYLSSMEEDNISYDVQTL